MPMRKTLIALTAVFALLTVSGCAALQSVLNATSFITTSVTNPVTPERLNAVEQALTVVFAAGNAWKKACRAGAAEANCRANIATAQTYTRKLPGLLTQLRAFVKNNDQVNAIVVYNQITAIIANFKSAAAQSGIPVSIGGL